MMRYRRYPPKADLLTLLPPNPDAAAQPFQGWEKDMFTNEIFGNVKKMRWWMAETSLAAYAKSLREHSTPPRAGEQILAQAYQLQTEDVKFYFGNCMGGNCFTLAHDRAFVLAFRGSEVLGPERHDLAQIWSALQDWLLTDANVALAHWTRVEDVRVHRGFRNAFDELLLKQDGLTGFFEQVKNDHEKRPLIITGHSLGGAMAMMAAAYCHKHLPHSAISVYTYGAPLAGGREFARFIENVEVHRTVFDLDIITRLPFFDTGFSSALMKLPFELPGFTESPYIQALAAYRMIQGDGQHAHNAQAGDAARDFIAYLVRLTGIEFFKMLGTLTFDHLLTQFPKAIIHHAPLLYALGTWNDGMMGSKSGSGSN